MKTEREYVCMDLCVAVCVGGEWLCVSMRNVVRACVLWSSCIVVEPHLGIFIYQFV